LKEGRYEKKKVAIKTFIVSVREIHVQPVEVEALNADDAIMKVREGEGEYVADGQEYSETLDTDTWTVEEKK
jgi:hypothetical protein